MTVHKMVLYVAHFVMGRHQKFACNIRALLDPVAEKPRDSL